MITAEVNLTSTNYAEWINAISSFIAIIIAGYGLKIAKDQLVGLKDELKNSNEQLKISNDEFKINTEQLRMNSLSIILEIEARIVDKEYKLNEVNFKIRKAGKDVTDVDTAEFECALQGYINAVDRLAYCILKGYAKDVDWRVEYRDFILGIIKTYPESFTAGSKYINIIDLNQKWQRES